jgi:hypothetical protein
MEGKYETITGHLAQYLTVRRKDREYFGKLKDSVP